MKYYCEACERLVPPAAFRMEDGLLVLKCSRCKVEMRGTIEQDEVPAPSSRSSSSSSVPKVTVDKAFGDKPSGDKPSSDAVIALGQDDAEPDPIENEPTRRMAVPAELLQAIEEEARENRRKKDKEKDREKDATRERPREKAPVPVLESAPDKAPAPVKVAEFPKSESGAPNLTVLRLSDVQSPRAPEPAPAPALTPAPVRTATPMESPRAPALRVVREGAAAASAGSDDVFMPPAGFCPKCIGIRKEGSQVCPFCGLDFARYRPDDFRPSPMVASTWLGVQELWETRGAHDKVLALASERGELPALGRLYRVRLARQPEDAMALRGREEVLRLAAAGSLMLATPPPDKGTKMRAAVMSAFLFALVVLLVAMGVRAWKLTMGTP